MPTPDDTDLLVDAMLGTLTRYLRMCGYDAAYSLDRELEDDEQLLAVADAEGRTILTRDVELAEGARDALLVESLEIDGQLRELVEAGFELSLDVPRRCSRCNGPLQSVEPAETTPSFAPDPDERRVWRCVRCGQPYWRGSHWDDVARRLADATR